MWKTTLDECRLAEIVISKMARPANRRRDVGAGLMHKQGREEERVPSLDFDRDEFGFV